MSESITKSVVWLDGIGIFDVVENEGDGDCLFRCISQALTISLTEKNHLKIRKQVVRHIVNKKWDVYRPRIIEHWACFFESKKKKTKHLSDKTIRKKFSARMTSAKECGTLIELMAAGDLFNFHFDYLSKANNEKSLYAFHSCRTNGCNVSGEKPIFLFYFSTFSDGTGHWELLRPISLSSMGLHQERFPLNRKIFGVRIEYEEPDFSNQSYNIHPDEARSDAFAISIGKRFERKARKLDLIPVENDTDWPPDEGDDHVGCASMNFKQRQPRRMQKQNPFRIIRKGFRTLFTRNNLKSLTRVNGNDWSNKS